MNEHTCNFVADTQLHLVVSVLRSSCKFACHPFLRSSCATLQLVCTLFFHCRSWPGRNVSSSHRVVLSPFWRRGRQTSLSFAALSRKLHLNLTVWRDHCTSRRLKAGSETWHWATAQDTDLLNFWWCPCRFESPKVWYYFRLIPRWLSRRQNCFVQWFS